VGDTVPRGWRLTPLNWAVSGLLAAGGLLVLAQVITTAERVAALGLGDGHPGAPPARLAYVFVLLGMVPTVIPSVLMLRVRQAPVWPVLILASTSVASLALLGHYSTGAWPAVLEPYTRGVEYDVGRRLSGAVLVGLTAFLIALLAGLAVGHLGRRAWIATMAATLLGTGLAYWSHMLGPFSVTVVLVAVMATIEPSGRTPPEELPQ
jgi:hypothetical protein